MCFFVVILRIKVCDIINFAIGHNSLMKAQARARKKQRGAHTEDRWQRRCQWENLPKVPRRTKNQWVLNETNNNNEN